MLGDYIRRPLWRVVVNLLQELGVGVDLVRHGNWLGESNEFHKRFFYLGLEASFARHAARLIIFEIMRLVLFRRFKCSSLAWNQNHPHEAHDEMRPHFG